MFPIAAVKSLIAQFTEIFGMVTVIGNIKMRQFEQMVSAWDCEELWEKTVRLRPPYYASAGWGGSYVEQLAWGELASYLRKALKLKPTA